MHQDLQSSKSMSPSKPEEHAAGGGESGGERGGVGGGSGNGTTGGDGGTRQKSHALHLHRPLQLASGSLTHQLMHAS